MNGLVVAPKPGSLSVERAQQMLAEARGLGEVKAIRDQAVAIATYARAQKAGKAIALDAGEIILDADRRIGELSRELSKAPQDRKSKPEVRALISDKQTRLADIGISTQRASELERIATIPQKQFDAYKKAERGAGRAPSPAGAVALARLDAPKREQAIAKLGEVKGFREAIGAVKLETKRALAETIRKNPIVTPDGRYQVIVVDPPWKYGSRAEDVTHRGKNPYPDMDTDEILKLPVPKLAQPNCILWLWTTNAFMRDAYCCLDKWGFDDKTILTWDKEIMGLGDWLRNVTEHCILSVKGKPVVALTNQTTIIHEKRREHSRKPEAFYSMVNKLCPGSKLEMFSRQVREGWTQWGAEAGKF